MTIEHIKLNKLVGEVQKRNKRNQTLEVYLYDKDMEVQWTREFILNQDEWSIDDNDLVYRKKPEKRCSECGNKNPLYDSKTEEFYCSVCES